jgi:hypothetical protein
VVRGCDTAPYAANARERAIACSSTVSRLRFNSKVRSNGHALARRGTLGIPADCSTASRRHVQTVNQTNPTRLSHRICEAVLSYQDWAPGNAEPTVVFCGHVEPISAICAMVESFKSDQIPGDIFLRLCAYVRVGDEYLKIDLASDRCYSKAADCLLQLIQRRVTEYVRQEAWRRDRA